MADRDKTINEQESIPAQGKLFRLDKRGVGVYGIVYSACEDNDKTITYAVKRNLIDVTGDFIGSVKELDILIRLNGHPHIVLINSISFGDPFGGERGNVLSPIGDSSYKDDKIHFIFEEAQQDGASYFKNASWKNLKQCMVHLLLGIEYCHGKRVIHRDLKPANLLIFDQEGSPKLKICDFGLSKPSTYQGNQTPDVVTSWYRAPEIVLQHDYDERVDLWSIGCIFYEMVTKLPLLNGSPDRDSSMIDQLNQLFPQMGLPVQNSDERKSRRVLLRRNGQTWKSQLERKAPMKDLESQGWKMDSFLDLMTHLLCQPNQRYTAKQALDHDFWNEYKSYIAQIRDDYPPLPDPEGRIVLVQTDQRSRACVLAEKIFSTRHMYPWYSHRILFQAISLFDRYTTSTPTPQVEQSRIRLAFTACLYLSVKYFSTLCLMIPISALYGEIAETEKRWVEQFEISLLERITGYTIYEPTIYEAADDFNEILDDDHVLDLLIIYIQGEVKVKTTGNLVPINGLTPTQVYSYYRGKTVP